MTRLVFLLILVSACPRPTPPAAERQQGISTAQCGADCTSSITCGSVFSSCRYCGPEGTCTSTLPANPKPDAGVDAPPPGTTR